MKERGLGTPATRAEIIETLLRRGYAERQGKAARGHRHRHPARRPRALRREERRPDRRVGGPARAHAPEGGRPAGVHAEDRGVRARARRADPGGAVPRAGFLSAREPGPGRARRPGPCRPARPGPCRPEGPGLVGPRARALSFRGTRGDGSLRNPQSPRRRRRIPCPGDQRRPPGASPGKTAAPRNDLDALLRERFRLPSFRPHQEAVCRAVVDGRDVLLVMPTGAGKSLCYQLPGLARGGTTLVVSPLIALMDDQVAKLQALGLRAERIHSGRDRAASRAVGAAYVEGRLDFLFIAPERLRRARLRRDAGPPHARPWWRSTRPTASASGGTTSGPTTGSSASGCPRCGRRRSWRSPPPPPRASRPTSRSSSASRPRAASSTASAARTSRSRRRPCKPGDDRAGLALRILREPERRPAIVYAPTRKGAEELATALAADARKAAAYHAGMAAPRRERVQTAFLAGELDVIVATIAFGMGIDKPDVRTVVHTAMPVDGRGLLPGDRPRRARREGLARRAPVLLGRPPHARVLPRARLPRAGGPRPPLPRAPGRASSDRRAAPARPPRPRGGGERPRQALDPRRGAWSRETTARAGRAGWRPSYVRQREHKKEQLDEVLRFAESHGCRMLHLLRHFGDEEDRTRPCGGCDACAPRGDGGAAVAPADATGSGGASPAWSRRCGNATGRPRGSSTARWPMPFPSGASSRCSWAGWRGEVSSG